MERAVIWRRLLRLIGNAEAAEGQPWTPYASATHLTVDQAQAALTQTGLCHGRLRDIAYVRAAIDGNPFPTGLDLRRHGTRLGVDELRCEGIRTNAIVTVEYLEILTSAGRRNPIDAAQAIISAYQTLLAGTNALARARHAGITFVEVIPNNMAAGPCSGCLALAEKPIPIADAPSGPLAECPHPTQCKLWTRAVIGFD